MTDQNTLVGRRIRAAIELAGLNGFAELADRINERGLGERTLRKLADPAEKRRTAKYSDIVSIARATGQPIEFFTQELHGAIASGASDSNVTRLEQKVDALSRHLGAA